jgi:hypothetical protein
MRFTSRSRRIAAVLAVVFLLTTVWAVYYLDSELHPNGPSGPGTLATYSQAEASNFSASLRPSVLYNNSTEVNGGNVTLFTPITNWINTTLVYEFSANRSVTLTMAESFTVVVATPVWSKVLYSTVNSTEPSGPTSLYSFTTRFAINVSAVEALVTSIDTQLGYTAYTFTVTLAPTVFGSVDALGVREPLSFQPQLNFTFESTLIHPNGLSVSADGSVLAPAPSSSGGSVSLLPVLAVTSSVGGVGGSLWVATRRPEEEETVPLPQLISPYEEAIAETEELPGGENGIRVGRFEDLAKIADALGKPILRPKTDPGGPAEFRVIDGGIAYVYRYHEPAPGAVLTATDPATAVPGVTPSLPASLVLGASSSVPLQRLKEEVARLRLLPLSPELLADARALIHAAIALIRAGREREAMRNIDILSVLITNAASRRARSRTEPPPSP